MQPLRTATTLTGHFSDQPTDRMARPADGWLSRSITLISMALFNWSPPLAHVSDVRAAAVSPARPTRAPDVWSGLPTSGLHWRIQGVLYGHSNFSLKASFGPTRKVLFLTLRLWLFFKFERNGLFFTFGPAQNHDLDPPVLIWSPALRPPRVWSGL